MFRIFLAILVCMAALPVLAQDFNQSLKDISEINRIQPLQNPNYEGSGKILTRRVLDRKSHVIGEIQDVIYKSNGGIKSLQVEFDRLRLTQPVFVNYHEMNVIPAGRAYQLSLEDNQIASIYPQLLSEIETAGGEGSDEFSAQKTLGTAVTAKDGRMLGTVDDVLFSAEGDRVEALYVKLQAGLLNGKRVAVPLDSLELNNNSQTMSVVLPNEVANAVIDFAQKRS